MLSDKIPTQFYFMIVIARKKKCASLPHIFEKKTKKLKN